MTTTRIAPEKYRTAIPALVRDAFRDASLRTNPRMPMLDELAALFEATAT